MIRYLKREEIHDKKWNGCVHFAINGFPYGYTWYLDNVAEFWDGLVYKDYRAVFPLVWNKKYGVYYLYQPLFTQQLGIFSLKPLDRNLINSFLDHIPERFRFIEINLNYLNHTEYKDFEFTAKPNLTLDLHREYEAIQSGYSSNTKRNIKKAKKNGLSLKNNLKPEKVVAFFQEHIAPRIPEVEERHFHSLHRVIYQSLHYGMGQTCGVFYKGELCGTGFFIYAKNKLINLLPSVSELGRDVGASPFMIDYIILVNANTRKTLDFEGSEIPSIARFYKGFGAQKINYWRLKRNTLPWYMKLFKK